MFSISKQSFKLKFFANDNCFKATLMLVGDFFDKTDNVLLVHSLFSNFKESNISISLFLQKCFLILSMSLKSNDSL